MGKTVYVGTIDPTRISGQHLYPYSNETITLFNLFSVIPEVVRDCLS